jgi:hypothetical protein
VAIPPQPSRGVVPLAPCSFNSLNKLARGIANNLALALVVGDRAGHAGDRRPIIERAAPEPP